MSLNDKLFILFAGIGALLGAASLIGFVHVAPREVRNGAGDDRHLNARIRAWWVMIAIFAVSFPLGAASRRALLLSPPSTRLRSSFR